jgi:hypothetical protein
VTTPDLWCIHVLSTHDLYCVPDRSQAQQLCEWENRRERRYEVRPWKGDPKVHARWVGHDWKVLTGGEPA